MCVLLPSRSCLLFLAVRNEVTAAAGHRSELCFLSHARLNAGGAPEHPQGTELGMASPPGSNSWLAASWEERKGKGREGRKEKQPLVTSFICARGGKKKKKEIKGKQESELGSVRKAVVH